MAFQLTSSGFQDGSKIPARFTGDGADCSPPLEWSEAPPGTKSFALVCEDPDAPGGTWIHWVLFNLPASVRSLEEGVAAEPEQNDGARHGVTDFQRLGYGGPAPPRGMPHRYYFRLYAIDRMLELPAGASRADLTAAIQGHVVAEAVLMGTYQR